MTAEAAKIEQLIREWEAAICAGDIGGILAAHDRDIVMFDVPAPLEVRGIADYETSWLLFFAHAPAGPHRFRVTDLRIMAGESVAFAHGLLIIGGGDAPPHCRLTLGLCKTGSDWRITHEHHSMPLPA